MKHLSKRNKSMLPHFLCLDSGKSNLLDTSRENLFQGERMESRNHIGINMITFLSQVFKDKLTTKLFSQIPGNSKL